MSPTTPPTATNGNHTFAGGEFSNNLLSDLAPLLTLFGEQVTKQFLSMSMGWMDNILVAVGPLGIMTVLVSTIRVSGVKRLKALVGRARESRATAEAELLSSTSDEVCEMWNGREVVRIFGMPKTRDLIIVHDGISLRAMSLEEAYTNGYLKESGWKPKIRRMRRWEISELSEGAPNLTLNIPGTIVFNKELLVWTLISVLIQAGALIYPGITSYRFNWLVASYGYTCFVLGTVAVTVGLMLCSRIIEGSTDEHEFVPDPQTRVPILFSRLQLAATVGEARFSSYVTNTAPGNPRLRMSRLNNKDCSTMSIIAVSLTLGGFVGQFVGLRALHWSATVVALGCTLVMTGIRSWVRRGLASGIDHLKLPVGYEASWMTLHILQHVDAQGLESLANLCFARHASELVHLHSMLGKTQIYQYPFDLAIAQLGYYEENGKDCFGFYFQATNERQAVGMRLGTRSAASDLFYQEIDLLVSIQRLLPVSKVNADRASQLSRAMNATVAYLCQDPEVKWCSTPPTTAFPSWDLHIIRRRNYDTPLKAKLASIRMGLDIRIMGEGNDRVKNSGEAPHSGFRSLSSEEEIRAVLSLLSCGGLGSGRKYYITPKRIIGVISPADKSLERFASHLDVDLLTCAGKGRETMRCTAFGCQYSSLYTDDSNPPKRRPLYPDALRETPSMRQFDHHLGLEVFVDTRNMYDVECALEIFATFMLELASLVSDLGGEKFKEKREVSKSAVYGTKMVYRNSTVESLIHEVMKNAPGLFPDRQTAEIILIPAFLKYDLLGRARAKSTKASSSVANSQTMDQEIAKLTA